MLRINGYIILFKKLNRKNMPMHIDSKVYQAIENQMQGTLFARNDDFIEPILFLATKKINSENFKVLNLFILMSLNLSGKLHLLT